MDKFMMNPNRVRKLLADILINLLLIVVLLLGSILVSKGHSASITLGMVLFVCVIAMAHHMGKQDGQIKGQLDAIDRLEPVSRALVDLVRLTREGVNNVDKNDDKPSPSSKNTGTDWPL